MFVTINHEIVMNMWLFLELGWRLPSLRYHAPVLHVLQLLQLGLNPNLPSQRSECDISRAAAASSKYPRDFNASEHMPDNNIRSLRRLNIAWRLPSGD